jgi:hypothetical protein
VTKLKAWACDKLWSCLATSSNVKWELIRGLRCNPFPVELGDIVFRLWKRGEVIQTQG